MSYEGGVMSYEIAEESFAQQAEGAAAVAPQHGIVDASKHRGGGGKGFRQFKVVAFIKLSHIVKIELIEHRMLPVAGKHGQVLSTESLALGKEAVEPCLRRELFGRFSG